jgi:hypothetical protein
VAEAQGAVVQFGAEGQQGLGAAALHQRQVEGAVVRLPVRVRHEALRLGRAGRARQPVVRDQHPLFPGRVAAGDGGAQRGRFNQAAGLDEVAQCFRLREGDAEAPLVDPQHKSLGRQLAQRLP